MNDTLLRALRHALRHLAREPLFTLGVAGTLALGVGVNAAVFGVADNVLVRPLPFPGSERMVVLWETGPRDIWKRTTVSVPDYLDWSAQSSATFDLMAAYATIGLTVRAADRPERVRAQVVSSSFFSLLGVRPALGRDFTRSEDANGGGRAVLLSHGYWQRQFGGDASVVGRAISVGDQRYQVIGVMPADLRFPDNAELWVPLGHYTGNLRIFRPTHVLTVIGRLREGVSVTGAESAMSALAQRLWDSPTLWTNWRITLQPMREHLFGSVRTLAVFLWVGALLVLVVTCANLANLFLAAGVSREREVAVRAALGAGRTRLGLELMAEVLLLALIGAIGGLLLGASITSALSSLLPESIGAVHAFAASARMFVYASAVALLMAFGFGLGPVLWMARRDPAMVLRGGRTTTSHRHRRLRDALVVAQLSLSLTLLVTTLLVAKSFARLRAVDAGFRSSGVIAARLSLTGSAYDSASARRELYRRMTEAVSRVPGVSAVAAGSHVPFTPTATNPAASIFIDGVGRNPSAPTTSAEVQSVSAAYFDVLGIPLIEGRAFTNGDDQSAPRVAVVNRTMARQLWPSSSAIGARLRTGVDAGNTYTVVGIVDDVKQQRLDAPPAQTVFLPVMQWPTRAQTIVVRSPLPLDALLPQLRSAVAPIDPTQPLHDVATADELLERSLTTPAMASRLLLALSALTVALAAVGVYAVVAYTVGRRRAEFSIRLALGARQADLLLFVLRDGALLTGAGTIFGVLGAAVAARFAARQLYGVSPLDAGPYAIAVGFIAAIALAATFMPARRASRIDPAETLRNE